jgi:hypothetical protein
MTKPSNTNAIEVATNIEWGDWLKFFDGIEAKNLSHRQIADKAYEKLGKAQASRGWWSQSVAVAYEQHLGRRQPGQREDGTYEVSVSITIDGTMDEAMQTWKNLVKGRDDFMGVGLSGKPAISKTEKWRHWRIGLDDGTRLSVSAYQKTPNKSGLAVTNTNLNDSNAVEQWRSYWKSYLKSF